MLSVKIIAKFIQNLININIKNLNKEIKDNKMNFFHATVHFLRF